ncbi:cilia- and flagella-associated protein 44 [Rhinophrynus dorsalis]
MEAMEPEKTGGEERKEDSEALTGTDNEGEQIIGDSADGEQSVGTEAEVEKEVGHQKEGEQNVGEDVEVEQNNGADTQEERNVGHNLDMEADTEVEQYVGSTTEVQENVGAETALQQSVRDDAEVEQNMGHDAEVEQNVGDDEEVEHNVGDDAEVEQNVGVDAEVEQNVGDDAEVEQNMGHDAEVEQNMGHDAEVEQNVGDDEEVEQNMGHDAEVEQNVGVDADVEQNMGHDAEVEQNMGHDAEVEQNMGHDAEVEQNMGYYAEVEQNMGHDAEVEQNVGVDAEVEQNMGHDAEVEQNMGDDAEVEQNVGVDAEVEQNVGDDAEVEQNVGHDAEVEQNVGDDAEVEQNVGHDAEVEQNVGDDAEVEQNVGDDAEVEQNVGDDAEVDQNVGDNAEVEQNVGVDAELEQNVGADADVEENGVDGDMEEKVGVDGENPVSEDPSDHTDPGHILEPSVAVEPDEEEEEIQDKIPEDFFYEYETICSQPYVTPDTGIPNDVLHLLHSFGYDCTKRANLHLLDDQTLLYVAGTLSVILSVKTQEQKYLRSSSGGGVGAVTVHPSKKYFSVAEKGKKPNIIIYEFPSLKPYRILRGGTEEAYAFVDFNVSGTLLASVGSSPDYMLTIWDWRQEKIMLRSKAFSQDVFQVTFSAENEEQLTTCGSGHIKFWKTARTFTGLKLQGELGRFGKTSLTDIEGYVELPDGKVISGSEWGNMLLWEGGLIKVELCRRGQRPCHSGPINQFVLDEGELITVGSDGFVRVWDFETVDTADSIDDSGILEMEPMNELQVGKNVNLRFMVKMTESESPVWFAQDANGAIWKLDLSFSNITQDPECLFSFHAGRIRALDASPSTYLMATTSLDRSVRIYDFVGKYPLVQMKFKQGGTSLAWAPRMVNPKGGLFAVGFEDGVVRILEVYNACGLRLVAGRVGTQESVISLKQAFKPHIAPVTALAYERNGEILATGSTDKTVFFFAVGDKYEPIGFVRVPGPVRELHWSPPSHEENTLLVLCENGYAVQIPAPAAEKRDPVSTFEIPDLPLQYFRFTSIKSKMERAEEVSRRQKVKEERKKEHEVWIQQQREQGVELTEEELMAPADDEEEEDTLPALYIPKEPSPILCGFYASPGKFWLSLDGYDSGFLYLCQFSDTSDHTGDVSMRRDEPLSALPVDNSSNNPIYKMNFSSNKQLLFCGMQDGSIRVYPLQANDPLLTTMHGYWSLGVHDNQYGSVQAVCTSYDNQYLVTCGADSNIFTFSILSMEDIARDLKVQRAKVPSPRKDLETEKSAEDIEDPEAYSIETAKQKKQQDLLMKQAEEKKARKRQELAQLRKEFQLLLRKNTELPTHMQLGRAEFEMDHRIREEMERQTSERIRTVLKELAWEQEKHNIGLKKLQARFRDNVEFDTVTVHAINSEHCVSTYRMLALSDKHYKVKGMLANRRPSRYELRFRGIDKEPRDAGSAEPGTSVEKEIDAPVTHQKHKHQWSGKHTGAGRLERMKMIIEKAEKAKSRISQRKREWAELYKQRPSEDYEDPQDVLAIKNAKENMGDFNLKTSKDYTVPEHLRINADRKRNELIMLEGMIHKQKSSMNVLILALRDLKVDTIKEIQSLVQELRSIQSMLDSSKHLPIPPVPHMHPDETPEKRYQYNSDTLQKFRLEQERKGKVPEAVTEGGFGGFEAGTQSTVILMEAQSRPSTGPSSISAESSMIGSPQVQEREMSELEKEIQKIEEIKNLYKQKNLIQKINKLVVDFDAELRILRHQKFKLDIQMKMADLRHVTLFEELLLLKEFEKREDILQERVTDRIAEKEEMKRKLEDYTQQLETKKRDIARLQEKERALHAAFQTSLGENNKFAAFLTKVFKKKIKRTRKKEAQGDEEEEDSDEDSDEGSSWESEEEESGSEDGVFDDSICPDNCDQTLFDNTVQLREKRLDIEEVLTEEKKIVDNLKKEHDALAKKVKTLEASLRHAEAELEAFQREKQQKLNELHVVVPLKLHQVDYIINGEIPSDLSQALVFTNSSLESLQQRIRELQLEKVEKRELYRQAREQHKQLIRDRKEMEAKIKKLEEKCSQQMMMKFGRLVDLEALQTLSVNTNLEELKIKSSERAEEKDREISGWEDKVMEMKRSLMEVTREHTKKLDKMNELLTERKALEAKLDARQTLVGEEFQGPRKADVKERQKLLQLVQMQAEEMDNLKEEISLLSKKGGSILPPAHPPMSHGRGTVA